MNRRHQRKSGLNAQMNVIPYIDVMLVLLIIFMVAAPMLTTGIDVSLPSEQTKTINLNDRLPMIISITAKGELFVSDESAIDAPTTLDQLTLAVKQQLAKNTELQVMIHADAKLPYEQVMQVMALVQDAGVSQVSLLSKSN